MKLTAIIEREGSGYVSLCPEVDIASQGDTIEQARDNLQEALALFFECASPEEVRSRLLDSVAPVSAVLISYILYEAGVLVWMTRLLARGGGSQATTDTRHLLPRGRCLHSRGAGAGGRNQPKHNNRHEI